MINNKKLIRLISVLLSFSMMMSIVSTNLLVVFGEQFTSIDVINKIEALPAQYSGIPFISGRLEDINYSKNASLVEKDNSVAFEGNNPVKVTSASGGLNATEFGKAFSQAMDLSELTNVQLLLWFYDKNPELKLYDLRIDLTTNTNNFYYLYVDTSSWRANEGTCRIQYDISKFKKYGNPDITKISKFNIRMTGVTGEVESLGVFEVTYNVRNTPKVILTFDDGWQDNYDNAFPILEQYGFKATTYVVSDFVQGNDPNYMRKPILDLLYSAGWDISNHSRHHENYLITPGADAPAMGQSYKVCQDYLLACGYERSARFVCYPDGSFDDDLIPYIKNIGVVSARTTRIGLNPTPPVDLYKLKQHYIGPTTTFGDNSTNDIKAKIDSAISSGQTLAIMMHRVSRDDQMSVPNDVSNTIKTPVSMLTQVAQYLHSTGVEVCTMSQWYNELYSDKKLTVSDRVELKNARIAYESLSTEQKALVINYKKLIDAEAKMVQLEAETLANAQTAISLLPLADSLNLADRQIVQQTRNCYELLSEEQKSLITNYTLLLAAEDKITQLQIDEVIYAINMLPSIEDIVILDDAKLITVKNAYDNLTTYQKSLVNNYDVLTNAMAKIEYLELEAANLVIAKIDALPASSDLGYEDKHLVVEAREEFNSLHSAKEHVTNLEKLVYAEAVIANFEQQRVIDKIDAFPDNYSGIPLINASLEDITYKTNALQSTIDTSVSFEGVSPIKITSETGGNITSTTFGKTFSQPKDLSSLTNIEMLLWFYEKNPELNLGSFRVDLVTDSGNYFYKYVDGAYWKRCPGAARLRYDISEFLKVGNPNLSNIKSFNFRMKGTEGMVESLGVFSVAYNARSEAKVILTFDDGWQDNYDNAYPILESYGFKAVSYVVSDFAQGTNPLYMKKPTLDILYNDGWDISNHSKHHENYKVTSGANAPNMGASYKSCLDYLLACGYERSARFACYPNGAFDDELIPYVEDIGIVSSRTTRIGFNAEPIVDFQKLKQVTIGPNTTFGLDNSSNDIKASIDKAIASGQTMTIMMHRVSLDSEMNTPNDITNTIKTSASMLSQVAAYLHSTGVRVCTMSEWYNELPSIKKLTVEDKEQVTEARDAYNQLSAENKALITNYKELMDAETKLSHLENSISAIKQYAQNKNAAALTISKLLEAGIVNVFQEDLAEYKNAVENANPSDIDTALKIQELVNTVNTPQITISDYDTELTTDKIFINASVNKGTINSAKVKFKENGSFTFVATYKNFVSIREINITNIIQKGDVTADGKIDIVDLTEMKQHLLKIKLLSGVHKSAGDIQNKGKVTISDLISVKKHILGIQPISQD